MDPKDEEQAKAIALRDEEQRDFYNDRIIKDGKKDKVNKDAKKIIVDNFTYETENTVDGNGKVTSKKVFAGGYQVVIND